MRWMKGSVAIFTALTCVVTLSGCNDLTGHALPAGTPNPSFYNSAAGALGMRNATVYELEQAIPQYILDTGLLTDELESLETGASSGVILQNAGAVIDSLDERILTPGTQGGKATYGNLQGVREFANQALGALAAYDTAAAATDSAKILRGELYAMEGYAEILLADFYCSGVPLSTLDYKKDFTYAPSSTTAQVYQDALVKLDSALVLGSKSDSVINLAKVLQGRAYIDLANYTAAADDVTTVPDGFQYQLSIHLGPSGSNSIDAINDRANLSNGEGINGLFFLSNGDARTSVHGVGVDQTTGDSLYFPDKYSAAVSGAGYTPFTLASGVEARLIQAEAAYHGVPTGQGSWIDQLNALRATIDLPSIADPGASNPIAQVDTIFTERAYWLYLDGHRQGDLRRLIRSYGDQSQYTVFRQQNTVYPTGPYPAPGASVYGTSTYTPIPLAEDANPNFHGCLNQ